MADQDEELQVTITRRDLAKLDSIISLFDALCGHFSEDFYDDAWNLRNHMVPFVEGDHHFDPACSS